MTQRTKKTSRSLNAADICKILDSCAKNGVQEIEIEGVGVKFNPNAIYMEQRGVQPVEDLRTEDIRNGDTFGTGKPKFIEGTAPDVTPELEAEVKQLQLDQMMIDDPPNFERVMNESLSKKNDVEVA